MPYVENYTEFKKRMDCPCLTVGNRTYFENGATSDGGGWWKDPPTDKWERLRLQSVYYRERFRRAETDLQQAKQGALDQLGVIHRYRDSSLPMPGAEDIEIFKKMRLEVEEAESDLNAIKSQLSRSPQEKQRQARLEREQATVDRADELINLINEI